MIIKFYSKIVHLFFLKGKDMFNLSTYQCKIDSFRVVSFYHLSSPQCLVNTFMSHFHGWEFLVNHNCLALPLLLSMLGFGVCPGQCTALQMGLGIMPRASLTIPTWFYGLMLEHCWTLASLDDTFSHNNDIWHCLHSPSIWEEKKSLPIFLKHGGWVAAAASAMGTQR